ncbi:hypothetical protein JCM10207_005447 [Rhodosporidiobolus poonsookiae]
MSDPKRLLTAPDPRPAKRKVSDPAVQPFLVDDDRRSGTFDPESLLPRLGSALRSTARNPLGVVASLGRFLAAISTTNKLVLLTVALFLIKVLPLPFTPPIPLVHPIPALLRAAEAEHLRRIGSAPQTLEAAYARYVQKHGRRPPKGWDAWWAFARRKGACRIDGFDEMYRSLGVWWAVEGAEVRERTEAIARSGLSTLGRVRVREGRVQDKERMQSEEVRSGGESFARSALEEMVQALVDEGVKLPDVDFFINELDEPRVVIPYNLRRELEQRGKKRRPRAPQHEDIVVHDINNPNEAKRPTYDVIRQSCPPSSAARRARLSSLAGSSPHVSQRYTSPFTTSPRLGSFVTKHDLERESWCDQPDLQELHQTFSRPLNFVWTDQLFPVFSNSKIEGFNDILIPTWYWWTQKMPYRDNEDIEWHGKANMLYWRGTNTGGRSIGLNWLGWMRSRLVSKVNRLVEWAHYDAVLLAAADGTTLSATLPSTALNSALTDVAFAAPDHHGEPDSLELQRTEPSFRFTDIPYVPFPTNYLYKAVLDMDGTAYSGRFPTLLASRSAVFKSRLFLQALDDTLIPWYHYVPVSLRFSELYHLLGYFFGVSSAPRLAVEQGFPPPGARDIDAVRRAVAHEEDLKRIAEQGREWAQKCARREDALVYVYLLVLEWARLARDDREGEAASLVL